MSIPAHCSEQKNPPQIFVQGARRRRLAAMPHIDIGATKVKAFGLGTIAIVLVSGEDCPNSLFEPSHESGVVGTPQRFTRVAQPNVDVRFALAGYVLE